MARTTPTCTANSDGPAARPGWFVYIARCADASLYTGVTTDVDRRAEQHNAGTASRYTRSRRPVCIVFREPHPSRSAALKREYAIKALPRREKDALIAAAKQSSRGRRALR